MVARRRVAGGGGPMGDKEGTPIISILSIIKFLKKNKMENYM